MPERDLSLTLEGVTVRRGRTVAVSDASTLFAPGRLTAVIGPNGAGKSSLIEAAAGVLKPVSGMVRLGDRPMADIDPRMLALQRAYLPQRAAVSWPISVERLVAIGLTPSLPSFGLLSPAMREAVDRVLAECDLLALRDRPATALSGGELARAMLARALVADPRILIADEPTAGLDPLHAMACMHRLRARAGLGAVIVVAIHDLTLVRRFADAVVAMRGGRILAAGPADTVLCADTLSRLFDLPVRVEADAISFLDPIPLSEGIFA
ncbi:ABC transporter ATP-binding protein [Sphingobium aquiterrae]|uniref:ABC transporter ATP-binding protein n=1 Tax=Sphingobium aquiterrae TaxID=2038656 RepID=UPI003019DF5B